MATFVLVHGAWHGGWCWSRVRSALQAKGHQFFTPTLTGIADRSHQLSNDINLTTHARDVANLMVWEELTDVVLCGHSYGGAVISAAAAMAPERVSHLVYLDAFVPENGESLIGLLGKALAPDVAAMFIGGFRGAALAGRSGLMQPIPAEVFNVAQANRAWVDRRCVPQALATFETPALLSGGIDTVSSRLYILADGWDPSPFRHFAAKFEAAPGWRITKLPCSHDVMVDMPQELARELLTLA